MSADTNLNVCQSYYSRWKEGGMAKATTPPAEVFPERGKKKVPVKRRSRKFRPSLNTFRQPNQKSRTVDLILGATRWRFVETGDPLSAGVQKNQRTTISTSKRTTGMGGSSIRLKENLESKNAVGEKTGERSRKRILFLLDRVSWGTAVQEKSRRGERKKKAPLHRLY